MLRGLVRKYNARRVLVVSSAVFALFHIVSIQVVIAFPVGLFARWLTLRTGSLVPAMIAHAAVNAGPRLFDPLLSVIGYSNLDIDEMLHIPGPLVGAAVVLGLVGCFGLARRVTRLPPSGRVDHGGG